MVMSSNLKNIWKGGDIVYKVISGFRAGKYAVLKLDQGIIEREYKGFRIDGKDYKSVPVYDLPGHIAIEAEGSFVGKTIECF